MIARALASSVVVSICLTPIACLADPSSEAIPSKIGHVNKNDSVKGAVRSRIGFQSQLQGAGTPNQAGLGAFLPLSVGKNSVFFVDVAANANFADRKGYSSIINTTVAGTTISTSSRLGYRWLNGDRNWMYGLNAGYDTRPLATGNDTNGVPLFGTQETVFFQQAAVSAEAISNRLSFNAYALIPTGETEQALNWFYDGGALNTYGFDAGVNLIKSIKASLGYYYQDGDLNTADGSGVLGRLTYSTSNGIDFNVAVTYDNAFDTRYTAGVKWRFDTNRRSDGMTQQPGGVIASLSSSPGHRDVRVHDSKSVLIVGSIVGAGVGGVIYKYKRAGTNKSVYKFSNADGPTSHVYVRDSETARKYKPVLDRLKNGEFKNPDELTKAWNDHARDIESDMDSESNFASTVDDPISNADVPDMDFGDFF